jgi:plasmid stabilization system protein ParE
VKLDLHPDARAELVSAAAWYFERNESAAMLFVDAVATANADIKRAPDRWPLHILGTRRKLLRRFPYAIIYRIEPKRILVVAVAHTHRQPGYWADR